MKIHYQGKTYASLAQLPPEGRDLFARLTSHLADHDRNGIPDLLEQADSESEITLKSDREIVINRHSYQGLDAASPEDQQLLRRMRQLFDQIGDEKAPYEPRTSIVEVDVNGSPVNLDRFRALASRYLGIDDRHPLASHFTWPGILFSPLVHKLVWLVGMLVMMAIFAVLNHYVTKAVGL